MVDKKDTVYLSEGRNPARPYCPACGKLQDEFTGISEKKERIRPRAGDVSICAYCGVLCVFEDGGALRLPTFDEATEMMKNPMVKILLERGPILDRDAP